MEEREAERRDNGQHTAPAIEEESGLQYILQRQNLLLFAFLILAILTVAGATVAIIYGVVEHFWVFADIPEEVLATMVSSSHVANVALQKEMDEDSAKTVFCFVNSNPTVVSPYTLYVENVSTSFCDAIVYTSVGIDATGSSIRVRNPDNTTALGFRKLAQLKKAPGSRSTAWVCVGGDESDVEQFKTMVSSRKARLAFIHNAIDWVKERKFDGVVIYWRYPDAVVKSNLSTFLNTAQSLFGKGHLGMAIVLPWNLVTRRRGYFVRSLFDRVDFVILDSHRTVDPSRFAVTTCQSPVRTGFRARHHGQLGLTSILDDLSMEADHPLKKTMLSISLGGVSFTVRSTKSHRPGMRVAGPGRPMGYTNRAGIVSYYEVMETLLKNASWTRFFDAYTRCSVAYYGDQWLGFEDGASIHAKKSLIRKTSGIAIWNLEMDDFAGDFGPSWPLLMETHDVVHGQVNSDLVAGTIVF